MPFWKAKNKDEDLTDIELIARYRNSHDNKYVGILYQRYTHLVFGVCMKYLKNQDDAQDAAMQIFENLMTHLKKHEITNFKSWLHMVSKNHCLMGLRKQQTVVKKEEAYLKTADNVVENDVLLHLDDKDDKETQLNALEDAIKSLKAEQKECVELFYIKEKNYKEVAEITGYTLKQVKSYIQNGKRNLKNYLDTE